MQQQSNADTSLYAGVDVRDFAPPDPPLAELLTALAESTRAALRLLESLDDSLGRTVDAKSSRRIDSNARDVMRDTKWYLDWHLKMHLISRGHNIDEIDRESKPRIEGPTTNEDVSAVIAQNGAPPEYLTTIAQFHRVASGMESGTLKLGPHVLTVPEGTRHTMEWLTQIMDQPDVNQLEQCELLWKHSRGPLRRVLALSKDPETLASPPSGVMELPCIVSVLAERATEKRSCGLPYTRPSVDSDSSLSPWSDLSDRFDSDRSDRWESDS